MVKVPRREVVTVKFANDIENPALVATTDAGRRFKI
jgi:hypothetical protein